MVTMNRLPGALSWLFKYIIDFGLWLWYNAEYHVKAL